MITNIKNISEEINMTTIATKESKKNSLARTLFGVGTFVFALPMLAQKEVASIQKNLPRSKDEMPDYSYYWFAYENRLRDILKNYDFLDSTFISFAKKIPFLSSNSNVVYIDFIYDYGFVVMDDSYIYEYEVDIDLSSMHCVDFVYDPYEKFLVLNELGYYEKIFSNDYTTIITQDEMVTSSPILHSGQMEAGDGQITSLENYVADRYPGYSLYNSNQLTNYYSFSQWSTSVYMQTLTYHNTLDVYGHYSEGNCVINSTYSVLYNLISSHDSNGYERQYYPRFATGLGYSLYSEDVSEEYFYADYSGNNYVGQTTINDVIYDAYWNVREDNHLDTLTELLIDIRLEAIENGYDPAIGVSPSVIPYIIDGVDDLYNYSIPMLFETSSANVMSNIDVGMPSFISAYGSETYKNHTMAVCGYAIYRKINFDNTISFLFFWKVDSGHMNDGMNVECWYDSNPPQSTQIFTAINRANINWPGC